MGIERQIDAYGDWEGLIDELRYRCPECGCLLNQLSEQYDVGYPYQLHWYECPKCGFCAS
ncbi:MAG: hypothetical protein ACOYBE_01515 [Blautia sp.]|jgi:uncharacterized protein with PIN domain